MVTTSDCEVKEKSAGRVVDTSLPGLQTQPLGKQFMADNAAGTDPVVRHFPQGRLSVLIQKIS